MRAYVAPILARSVAAATSRAGRSGSSAGSASSSRCCGPIAPIARSCSAATTPPCSTSGSRRSSTPAPGLARSIAEWPPFADTRRALSGSAKRHRLAIVSNIDRDLLADSVGQLAGAVLVAGHGRGRARLQARSEPFELAHRAARRCRPSAILHAAFGWKYDFAPARALGMRTCFVNRGGVTVDEPRDLEVPSLDGARGRARRLRRTGYRACDVTRAGGLPMRLSAL